MEAVLYTPEQIDQFCTLEELIFNARCAQTELHQHKANLYEWLYQWVENHDRIGTENGETRPRARALNVYTTVLFGTDKKISYSPTGKPGLYTREEESDEEWEERNEREAAILARNIVMRNVPDYEDRYGINK